MCQIVNEIVHRDAVSERRPLLRISRIIRPLPGIAQIHVVADGDHDPALVVANATPMRYFPGGAFFVGDAGLKDLRAGNLKAVLQVIDRVKNRVVVGDVLDGAVGKDPP
jgi:hypothetical protein